MPQTPAEVCCTADLSRCMAIASLLHGASRWARWRMITRANSTLTPVAGLPGMMLPTQDRSDALEALVAFVYFALYWYSVSPLFSGSKERKIFLRRPYLAGAVNSFPPRHSHHPLRTSHHGYIKATRPAGRTASVHLRAGVHTQILCAQGRTRHPSGKATIAVAGADV